MKNSKTLTHLFSQIQIVKIREIAYPNILKMCNLTNILLYVKSCFIDYNKEVIIIKCTVNYNKNVTITESFSKLTDSQRLNLVNGFNSRKFY